MIVGQAAVWLVGTTAWAHEQVIGTKPLDELNTGSKVLVGLFVAGTAAGFNQVLGAVKNVGENYPPKVVQRQYSRIDEVVSEQSKVPGSPGYGNFPGKP